MLTTDKSTPCNCKFCYRHLTIRKKRLGAIQLTLLLTSRRNQTLAHEQPATTSPHRELLCTPCWLLWRSTFRH